MAAQTAYAHYMDIVAVAPNWADITTAVATALTVGVLGVTAGIALWQLHRERQRRGAETVADWRAQWDDPAFKKVKVAFSMATPEELGEIAERAFQKDRSREDVERSLDAEGVPNFFESIALQVSTGGARLDFVAAWWGDAIETTWRHWQQAAEILRKYEGADAFRELESLASRMAEYQAKIARSQLKTRKAMAREALSLLWALRKRPPG